ncbi:hypothetical protein ACFWB0_10720 [Rhodococcus sp. NPDC060086]|uniref:hypothetical protein n=1 Tax=Rhodococcus sp. NPDC060086 TaxID=3347055 RepID=UPI003665C28E
MAVAVVASVVVPSALTGCATVMAGTPTETPSAPVEYLAPNTHSRSILPADKMLLEVAERLRRLDPCGLLPEKVIAGYGEVRQLGPQVALDTCTAVVHPSGGAKHDELNVTIDLSPAPTTEGGLDRSFGDTEVYRTTTARDNSAGCTLRFALDIPVTVTADAVPPARFATIEATQYRSDESTGNVVPVCDVAADVLSVTLARVPSLPARPTSGPGRIRLAAADPCEIVGSFAPEDLVGWQIDSDPYRCVLTPQAEGTAPQMWSIHYGLEPEFVPTEGDDTREVMFDGLTLHIRESGDSCRISAPVESVIDTNRPGAERHNWSGGRNVPAVVLTSDTPNCDELVPLTVEIADGALT